jgi:hypothetical protein
MIYSVLNKIRNMIVKSQLLGSQDDTSLSYTRSTGSLGQVNLAEVYYPYGYGASPVSGLGLEFSVAGQPENKTVLPYDPATKWVGLNPGEVQVGNQEQQTHIKFNADGTVLIKTNSLATIEGNLVVTGNISAAGTVSDSSGDMQAMRDAYNQHDHLESGGGTTGGPSTPMN